MLDNDMNASEREDLSRENKLLREENVKLKKENRFLEHRIDEIGIENRTLKSGPSNSIQEKSESFGEI